MSLDWVGAEGINVINFEGQQGSEALSYCSKEWPYCVNNPTRKSTSMPADHRDCADCLSFAN